MTNKLSEGAYRWGRLAQMAPVGIFLLSIPLAFITVWLAIAFWFVNAPVGYLLERHRPPEFQARS